MLVCVCVWASLRVKVFNVKSAKESATLMRVEKHVIPCTLLAQQPTPPPPPCRNPKKTPFLGHGPPLSLHFNLLHTLRRHSPALACQVAKSNVRSVRRQKKLTCCLPWHTDAHTDTPPPLTHKHTHARTTTYPHQCRCFTPCDKVALRFAFYCKLKDFFCLFELTT